MWKLTSKTGKIHYLLPEKEKHEVGRSNGDLILKDDSSISRIHAYLYPTDNHVKLIDGGSKYGTFYNENIDHNIAMDKNASIELKNGERVRFGVLQNEWILSNMKLVTITSTLSTDQKKQLKEILKLLNGEVIESFAPNCTHLTMRGITVTPKLLYALVERIPIVNCQYWRDYIIELRNGNSPPNPENYLPEISEEFLKFSKHLLKPNEGRKTLFAGKTFVFIGKKHYDIYSAIIPQAGGKIKTLNQGVPKSFLVQKNVIVIQYIPTTQSQSTQTIDDIQEYLKSKSLRMVPDYEIGLALVNCSTEKYCNPKFNVILDVCSPTKKSKTSQLEVIVGETPINEQTNTNDIVICEEIPESTIYEPQTETEKFERHEIALDSNEFNNEMKESDFVSHVQKNTVDNFQKKKSEIFPKIVQDNSISKQNVNKRKHDNINEDNEKMKRSCANKKTIEISKSRSEINTKINLDGFLNSSQIIKALPKEREDTENDSNKPTENENSKGNKRGRFAIITSDDDDDDLFDFGKSVKKSKPSNNTNSLASQIDNANSGTNNNLPAEGISTRIPKVTRQCDPIAEIARTIEITSGKWLSKSLIKLEIKDNDEKSTYERNTSNNDSIQSEWINSIREGFEVRSKQMILTAQTRQNISLEGSNQNSLLQSEKGKNFKAFVKKRNFIPQKEIVTTVPFQIHGFSF